MSSYTDIGVVSSSPISSFTPQTFTALVTLKLSDDNFLPWKPTTCHPSGFKLSHLLGDAHVPPFFLSATDVSTNTFNTIFVNFEQQDQLIVACLLSSMSSAILPR